jgi:hypothetical protein
MVATGFSSRFEVLEYGSRILHTKLKAKVSVVLSGSLVEQRLTSATLAPVGHELLSTTRAGRTKVGWYRRACRRAIPGVMVLFDALLATLIWEMASPQRPSLPWCPSWPCGWGCVP